MSILLSDRPVTLSKTDVDLIGDQETLRLLWEGIQDPDLKRYIRSRMYNLREDRMRDINASGMPIPLEGDYAPDADFNPIGTASARPSAGDSISESPSTELAKTAEQKRRLSSDKDVISEKIRRKSQERTQRYQKILGEIHDSDNQSISRAVCSVENEPTRAEDLGFSTIHNMEGSQNGSTVVKVDSESARSIGSPRKVTESSRRTSLELKFQRRTSIDRKVFQDKNTPSTQRGKSGNQLKSFSAAPITTSLKIPVGKKEATAISNKSRRSFVDELRRTVSRNESCEEDVCIITEVTEILRHLKTSGSNKSVLQKVTITKVTKKDLNGTILEETEDEVVDDIGGSDKPFLMSIEDLSPGKKSIPGSKGQIRNPKLTDVKEREKVKRTSSTSPVRVMKKRISPSSLEVAQKDSPRKAAEPSGTEEFLKKESFKKANSQLESPLESPTSPRSGNIIKGSSSPSPSPGTSATKQVPAAKTVGTRTSPSKEPDTSSKSSSRISEIKPQLAALGIPGALIKTVEITRTIRVRDDDKPWRINTKKATDGSNPASVKSDQNNGNSKRLGKNDLHGNVLRIVERYLDTEGCALHGCKHSHEPEEIMENEKPSRTKKIIATSVPRSRKIDKVAQTRPLVKTSTSSQAKKSEEDSQLSVDEDKSQSALQNEPTEIVLSNEEQLGPSYQEQNSVPDDLNLALVDDIAHVETPVTTPVSRSKLRLSFEKEKSKSPTRESNSSKEKLAASPALGSPAVVMKARSLFQSSESEHQEAKASPSSAEPGKMERKPSFQTNELPRKVSEASNARKLSKGEKIVAGSSTKCDGNIGSPLRETQNEVEFQKTPAKEQQNLSAGRKSPERGAKRDSKSQAIETIEDLTLLEAMLNAATGYDERSRIRSQIRVIRRKSLTTATNVDSSTTFPSSGNYNRSIDRDQGTNEQHLLHLGQRKKSEETGKNLEQFQDRRKRSSISSRKSPDKELKREQETLTRKSPEKEAVSSKVVPRQKSMEKKVEQPEPIFRPAAELEEVVQPCQPEHNDVPWRRKSSSHSPLTHEKYMDLSRKSPTRVPLEQKQEGTEEKSPAKFRSTLTFPKPQNQSQNPGEPSTLTDSVTDNQLQLDISRKHEIRTFKEASGTTPVTKPKAKPCDSFPSPGVTTKPERNSTHTEFPPNSANPYSESRESSPIRPHRKVSPDPVILNKKSPFPNDPEQAFCKESSPQRKPSAVQSAELTTSTCYLQLNQLTSAASAVDETKEMIQSEVSTDPTPWRKKSTPREPSVSPVRQTASPKLGNTSSVRSLAQRFQSLDSGSAAKPGFPSTRNDPVARSPSFKQRDTNLTENPISPETNRSSFRQQNTSEKSVVNHQNGGQVSRDEEFQNPSTGRRTSVERKTSTTWSSSYTVKQSSREQSPEKTSFTTISLATKTVENSPPPIHPKSFLEDRTPVRGMQDIIQRMRASDISDTNGRPNNDDEARSLLNKFLGAQILVQCTEALVGSRTPDSVEPIVPAAQPRSEEGKNITRLVPEPGTKRNSQSEVASILTDQRKSSIKTSATISTDPILRTSHSNKDNELAMADPCLVNGVDINSCEDDFKLNELLDTCNDYETRRKIRARIKVILSDPKRQNEIAKNIGNLGRTSITKSEVVTRSSFTSNTVRQSQPISAFSKFQQLDKNVKTTPSLAMPVVRARMSAAAIKERILQFCQRATADYKNVQIENFSSSWNNGLAFCALIHHFYPDAFDYDQLKPENRAYNFELAFKTAEEKAGIAPLLDVEDMVMMLRPDWKCVFTYVQSIYRRLKDD